MQYEILLPRTFNDSAAVPTRLFLETKDDFDQREIWVVEYRMRII